MRIKACSQKFALLISNEMTLIFDVSRVPIFLDPALLFLEWDVYLIFVLSTQKREILNKCFLSERTDIVLNFLISLLLPLSSSPN